MNQLHCDQFTGLSLAAELHHPRATTPKFTNRLIARRKRKDRRNRCHFHARAIPRGHTTFISPQERSNQFNQREIAAAGIFDEHLSLISGHIASTREYGSRAAKAV
jgi:hypothetical protein